MLASLSTAQDCCQKFWVCIFSGLNLVVKRAVSWSSYTFWIHCGPFGIVYPSQTNLCSQRGGQTWTNHWTKEDSVLIGQDWVSCSPGDQLEPSELGGGGKWFPQVKEWMLDRKNNILNLQKFTWKGHSDQWERQIKRFHKTCGLWDKPQMIREGKERESHYFLISSSIYCYSSNL